MTADARALRADDLPDRWGWATLGEVCEVNPRMDWPESFTEETPISFVPMAALDDVSGAIVAAEPRPIGEVWRGYKRFAEGDVIFARITPCMENGKAAIAVGLVNGIGLGSTEFHVLRPTDVISAEWVYHFVRQQSFRNEAVREMTGTAGQLRVPKSFMEEVSIPLPTLDEQRCIVARIEALFAQSRRGREALAAIPDLLASFRQAVLAAAFRGQLTQRNPDDEPASLLLERIRTERRRRWEEDLRAQGKDPSRRKYKEPVPPDTSDLPELPEGWAWTCFEELLTELRNGYSEPPAYEPPGIPILRISAVRPLSVTFDSPRYLRENLRKVTVYELRNGDLLFTRYSGSLALVGACGMVRNLEPPVLYPDKLMRARVFDEFVLPRYLELYFATSVARQVIEGMVKSSAGQQGISGKNLKSVPVAVAPLAEQRRIVARIKALFAQADALEAAATAAHRRLSAVDQAILARAFRGELVPQDPADEPASILLERIREQCERKEK